MIRLVRFLVIVCFICQATNATAQSPLLDNFTNYFFPYRSNVPKYGEEKIIYLCTPPNKYVYTPSPALPGLQVHQIQDSLCSVYKVKQSVYTLKLKGKKGYHYFNYESAYDEKGRLISYNVPEFSQAYTYYEDSVIENTTLRYGIQSENKNELARKLRGTYDKNKKLIRMICDDSVLVLERKYENGLLVQSRQIDHHSFTLGRTYAGSPEYLSMSTHNLSYYPGTSLLKSLNGRDSLVYSKEQPVQLESINGIALIYNSKGKLIEYNFGEKRSQPGGYGSPVVIEHNNYKYNYLPDGKLKSIIRTGGVDFYSNYEYDEKGRLTGMSGHLGTTSFKYLENGLISEMGGLKVQYTYY